MEVRFPLTNLKLRFGLVNVKPVPIGWIEKKDFNKVFVIGQGKTGTTSLGHFLRSIGLKIGNQGDAEMLTKECHQGDYKRLIKYCKTADAFQDMPFMIPSVYKVLDQQFPNSKFILTIRDSAHQWYDSLVRFHTIKYSSDPNRPPNEEDLSAALYRYEGWALDTKRILWDYPKVPLYDEKRYKQYYIDYNNEATEYFKGRVNNFIKINVSVKEDFIRTCSFLNVKGDLTSFPWENKTKMQ